jgi:hypothetical protein
LQLQFFCQLWNALPASGCSCPSWHTNDGIRGWDDKNVEYGDEVTHNQAVPQSPKKKAIEKSVLVAKGHMKTLHSYLEQNEAYASMIASTLEELLSDFQTTDSIMNESIANVKKKGKAKVRPSDEILE